LFLDYLVDVTTATATKSSRSAAHSIDFCMRKLNVTCKPID